LALLRTLFGWSFLAVVVLGAVLLAFMWSSTLRSVMAVVISLLAATMLALNHLALHLYIDRSLDEASREQAATDPEIFPDLDITSLVSVDSRWGFWTTAVYLGAFASATIVMLLYRSRTNMTGGWRLTRTTGPPVPPG
jgi:hypothetical protein